MRVPPKLLVTGMIVGGLLVLGPLFGLLGTAFWIHSSFASLSGSGINNPAELSHGIGFTLVSAATGLVLCPVGIVLLVVSIVLYSKARRPAAPPPLPPVVRSNNS